MDLASWRIPDALNLALLSGGLLWAGLTGQLFSGVLGGLWGFGASLLIRALYFKLRGRQGLGLGDVKFFGAAGVWVGWSGLPILLLISSVSALALVLGLQMAGRATTPGDRIAFGPHLSLGLMLVWMAKVFELG
jgi:leader peptidase (prepilin peptidase) / N-methyltransferase